MMDVNDDDIARLVLATFDQLPAKAKPLSRGSGLREWVPLCGIVAWNNGVLTCLTVATGMKCLPQTKISQAQGVVLHDWHAEILAIRSFNRYLLEECYALAAAKKSSSDFIRMRELKEITSECPQSFELKEGVKLHMYCSEAPCGDASMEITMAAQDDPTPWEAPLTSPTGEHEGSDQFTPESAQNQPTLQGRSYFSNLGIVRRKPSRPDAPPTLSKSCSDKLALHQCTSLLSSPVSLIISPRSVYLSTLILPTSQFSVIACERAFSSHGRMSAMSNKTWGGGYAFQSFSIRTTNQEFVYSRRQALAEGEKLVASNIAASWIHANGDQLPKSEVLIGGILQGRRKFDLAGASRTSRRSSWKLTRNIMEIMSMSGVPVLEGTYKDMKESEPLATRRVLKIEVRDKALLGWVRNFGDEGFELSSAVLKM